MLSTRTKQQLVLYILYLVLLVVVLPRLPLSPLSVSMLAAQGCVPDHAPVPGVGVACPRASAEGRAVSILSSVLLHCTVQCDSVTEYRRQNLELPRRRAAGRAYIRSMHYYIPVALLLSGARAGWR